MTIQATGSEARAQRSALYSRERLAGYDPARMKSAKVVIVGTGALGQNSALCLALSGVGELWVVDPDIFEEHNSTRSPYYPSPEEQERWGLGKAAVVAHKLSAFMTARPAVVRYSDSWVQALGAGAFDGATVILSAVDSLSGRAYLADMARLLNIPLVEGGFEGHWISLSCYPSVDAHEAAAAPCWRCRQHVLEGPFSCRFYAHASEELGIIPAIQNGAAALGALQAEAAIQAIHGEMPLGFKTLDFDIRTGKSSVTGLSRDPACPGQHRTYPFRDAIPLRAGTDDRLGDLAQEIEGYVGKGAIVSLPSSFVLTATCPTCGQWTRPMRPEWAWQLNPRCQHCSELATAAPLDPSPSQSPRVYPAVDSEAAPDLLAVQCRTAGLGARDLVEARLPGHLPRLFRLAGDLDDLYQSLTL